MGGLKDFIDYLEEQAANHSIYVWGAQGQKEITEEWIRSRETGRLNADRAVTYWLKQVRAGFAGKLRAFDCSGLAMYWLQNQKALLPSDLTAAGLYGQCEKLSRSQLKKGDWVFRHNGKRIFHVGFVVDDDLRVIEAKGRDEGVVKRALNASGSGYWNRYGRPKFFGDQIQKQPDQWIVSRVLKRARPMLRGEDVEGLQKNLGKEGFTPGTVDGIFGEKTEAAVRAYQKARRLTVDGKAGKNTVTVLGGRWVG